VAFLFRVLDTVLSLSDMQFFFYFDPRDRAARPGSRLFFFLLGLSFTLSKLTFFLLWCFSFSFLR